MANEHGIAGGTHNHAEHGEPDVRHAYRCLLPIANAQHVAHGLEQGVGVLAAPRVVLENKALHSGADGPQSLALPQPFFSLFWSSYLTPSFQIYLPGGTWVWFWGALRHKGPLLQLEGLSFCLGFLPCVLPPSVCVNTSSGSLSPLLSLPHHLIPVFSLGHPPLQHPPPLAPCGLPTTQAEEPLECPAEAELWGDLTTMWLMETQQSGGKSCSMGTRNCRQPSQ